MDVEVLYFQSVKKIAGRPREKLSLPSRATVADLVHRIEALHPGLAPLAPSLLFAVNEEHAPADHELAEGDLIALMPPFSGG